jgi:hypothetical protein
MLIDSQFLLSDQRQSPCVFRHHLSYLSTIDMGRRLLLFLLLHSCSSLVASRFFLLRFGSSFVIIVIRRLRATSPSLLSSFSSFTSDGNTGPGGPVLVPVHLSRSRAGMIPSVSIDIYILYYVILSSPSTTVLALHSSVHRTTAFRAAPVNSPHHTITSNPPLAPPSLTTASPPPLTSLAYLHAPTQPKTLTPHAASHYPRPLDPSSPSHVARRTSSPPPPPGPFLPSFRACARPGSRVRGGTRGQGLGSRVQCEVPGSRVEERGKGLG